MLWTMKSRVNKCVPSAIFPSCARGAFYVYVGLVNYVDLSVLRLLLLTHESGGDIATVSEPEMERI